MQPQKRIPTYPGEILRYEFLEPLGQSQVALAEHLGVSVQRVNELVRVKRGVTPQTARLLSQAFNTTPEFWLNLQATHDLALSHPARKVGKLGRASWENAPYDEPPNLKNSWPSRQRGSAVSWR